ncbi:hypothetical protein PFICI_10359 [Pestalotiopsis fici W106-1]|uniref:Leucine-rich repeat-containing protein 40 n=1 Tax=Pestalotiopsis fici (strain W106-1 / CGMCC3.15140) TaxID=1229662 RepID=W3WYW7_PESFW|nr:uncharacterized protein PFICI_10359 [Pestalotiopsis fici W106-1]ETS78297.1 hypothetical protein PFICI_10359 [Pestalotiopsis fici W106-1]
MDQKRLSTSTTTNRSSALPRPVSRLPQPRASGIPTPASSIRTAPSAEGLRGRFAHPRSSVETKASEPANGSRLRTPASREQLRATSTGPSTPSRRPQRLAGPPVSSQVALRGTKTRSISQEPRVERATQAAYDGHFKQSPVVGRRPSGQSESSTFLNGSAIDEDGPHEFSPSRPTHEDVSSDALGIHSENSKPGMSLAERTMETLSQLTSPAAKRRGSNFFDPELASRRPSSRAASGSSRPGSSHQHDSSSVRSLSRPSSRLGPPESVYSSLRAPSSTHKPLPTSAQEAQFGAASGLVKPLSFRGAAGAKRASSNPPLSAIGRRTPSPEDLDDIMSKPETLTPVSRSLRPKSAIPGLSKKSSSTSLGQSSSKPSVSPARRPRKGSATSTQSLATMNTASSFKERNLSSASTISTALTVDSVEESPSATTGPKSSSALREQIAKAKAARRAAANQQAPVTTGAAPLKSPLIPTDATFDFGLAEDPFNQRQFEDSNRKVMQSRIATARTTGRLNIAAMGLKQMPDEVVKMYDLESVGHGASWAESVDLTRLIAADNEFEVLDDSVFPDTDPMDFADADEGNGHQFGGLEALDLHGNLLMALPLGLRRLQNLTSLNLAQNKLANDSFEILSQIGSLRDLKLGGNLLKGKMNSSFASLVNLEALDLKGNEIDALPDGFERLTRLRVLNLNENSFESLPFDALAQLPLTELYVQKNKLKGTLVDVEVEALPHLQTLDVSNNQLSLIALGPISMPSLLQLTVSMNRLNSLPDLSTWKSLMTINAAENSISAFPDGFLSSESIKSADFTSNDIRVIPPEIARMDSLALLRMAGNPLRDKKFISMTTEELKDSLATRLTPLPEEQAGVEQPSNEVVESADHESYFYQPGKAQGLRDDQDDNESRSDTDNFATPPTSAPQSPIGARSRPLSSLTWPIKPGGVLDRANTNSSSLNPVICSKLVGGDAVREIRLQHNTFPSFPDSLSFFADTLTSINISHNRLDGEAFMGEGFEFPALRELHIAHNQIASLAPLITHLQAPNLQKLDISFNRVATLPVLRESFPRLDVLLVSNNRLEELDPTSVAGLRVVAADNNEIAHLNPRLGLLNLQRLEVTGNRFRVPRWDVLERGTEATLRWLRGRVPVAEVDEWKQKVGIKDEDDDFE